MNIGEKFYHKIKVVLKNKKITHKQLGEKINKSKISIDANMRRIKKNTLTLKKVQELTDGLDKEVIIELGDKNETMS